jgi:hypothetical protein
MVTFTTTILKFGENGDKTGWTYIIVPADIAEELNPGVRKSYRVQGKLDKYKLEGIALLPHGGGAFILPLKAEIRKAIAKKEGAMLQVRLEPATAYELDKEFMACLQEVPEALACFNGLTTSYRNYYSKWIQSVKSPAAREKRIVIAIASLAKKETFAEMVRSTYKKNQLP